MIVYYTFYDSSGENLLFSGTAEDLVQRKYFKNRFSVQNAASRAKRGIDTTRMVIIEKLAEEDYREGGDGNYEYACVCENKEFYEKIRQHVK